MAYDSVTENSFDDNCISLSCSQCGSQYVFECQTDHRGDTVDVEVCCNDCGYREWVTFSVEDYMNLCI